MQVLQLEAIFMNDESMRERLGSPEFLAKLRAAAPGEAFRSEEDMRETLRAILARHDASSDLHVFAYGSLLWNPGLESTQEMRAHVHGWHRSFCLRNVVGRGSPREPGLMLALDDGGSCKGLLYRISAPKVRGELELLWRREMATGSYDARWVSARAGSTRIEAVTFVANRRHERYVRSIAVDDMVTRINAAKGSLGSCRAYFDRLMGKLHELGIEDRRMKEIQRALARSAR